MSAEGATRESARSRFVGRLVGAAAIVLAASLVIQNAVLAGTGAPAFGWKLFSNA